jgi:hypothetical protein
MNFKPTLNPLAAANVIPLFNPKQTFFKVFFK